MRRITPMPRLRQAKRNSHPTLQRAVNKILLLLLIAKMLDHDDRREVAHNRMLILQVIEQPQSFTSEMFSDHGHPEVCSAAGVFILAAKLFGEAEAVEASFVGKLLAFDEEIFPFVAWETAFIPVGARVFAAMVEEAVVVVLTLEGVDFVLDELVEAVEVGLEIGGDVEVHGCGRFEYRKRKYRKVRCLQLLEDCNNVYMV
jgi:nucleoid DNA-binding protein